MRGALIATLMALLGACSSSSSSGDGLDPLASTGPVGQPIPADTTGSVLRVAATVNGIAGPNLVIDTGAPVVIINPASVPGLPNGPGNASVAVGQLLFPTAPVVGVDLFSSATQKSPIDGVIGCTVICHFALSLNYRDGQVTLGDAAPPANLDPAASRLSVEIEGGGQAQIQGVSQIVRFPPSRVVTTATIEGTVHTIIIDSGASAVSVRQSVMLPLLADGRGQGQLQIDTMGGFSGAITARLRTLTLGTEIDGAVAITSSTVDTLLDGIQAEVGHPIDAIVGGTFLREFYVTVDYPRHELVLQKYTTRDHIIDEGDQVGLDLTAADGASAIVVKVYPGTDAAKQNITPGDRVSSIDGTALATLDADAVNALLHGKVGESHTLVFGDPAHPGGITGARTLKIDDLLPLD